MIGSVDARRRPHPAFFSLYTIASTSATAWCHLVGTGLPMSTFLGQGAGEGDVLDLWLACHLSASTRRSAPGLTDLTQQRQPYRFAEAEALGC